MTLYKVYTIEKGIVETDNFDAIKVLTWHREDGPAFTKYHYNGKIEREIYRVNDVLHRECGPAIIVYDYNGNIQTKQYWLNGDLYNEKLYNMKLLLEVL
jgi:antitoxin component YwqK of YwqJK toxin-antitoxin module